MRLAEQQTSALPIFPVGWAVANLSWTSYCVLTSVSYPYLRMTQKKQVLRGKLQYFFFFFFFPPTCHCLAKEMKSKLFFQPVACLIKFSFQVCVSFPALPGGSDLDLQPAVGNSQVLVNKLLSGQSALFHYSPGERTQSNIQANRG